MKFYVVAVAIGAVLWPKLSLAEEPLLVDQSSAPGKSKKGDRSGESAGSSAPGKSIATDRTRESAGSSAPGKSKKGDSSAESAESSVPGKSIASDTAMDSNQPRRLLIFPKVVRPVRTDSSSWGVEDSVDWHYPLVSLGTLRLAPGGSVRGEDKFQPAFTFDAVAGWRFGLAHARSPMVFAPEVGYTFRFGGTAHEVTAGAGLGYGFEYGHRDGLMVALIPRMVWQRRSGQTNYGVRTGAIIEGLEVNVAIELSHQVTWMGGEPVHEVRLNVGRVWEL